jgi:hypothetical protein
MLSFQPSPLDGTTQAVAAASTPGIGANAFEELLLEGDPRFFRKPQRPEVDRHGENLRAPEAGVERKQVSQGSDEEQRPHQENQGKGDLADDERAARRQTCETARDAASPGFNASIGRVPAAWIAGSSPKSSAVIRRGRR